MKPTIFFLTGNYRCSRAVCDAANRLIRHNTNRVDKLTVSATGQTGLVLAPPPFDTEQDELAKLANTIARRAAGECPHEEAAVLCRTNQLVKFFANGLRAAGIPVKERKRDERPQDWPLARLIAAFAANPDNDYLATAYISATKGATEARAAATLAAGRLCSVNESQGSAGLPYGVTAGDCARIMARAGVGQETIFRVEQLIASLSPGAGPLEWAAAMGGELDDARDDGEGVTVCTVHAMKGREATDVYLPACEQAITPGLKTGVDLEEERRVFFVGITRAKRTLVLTHSKQRTNPYTRRIEEAQPSQFISEIGLL